MSNAIGSNDWKRFEIQPQAENKCNLLRSVLIDLPIGTTFNAKRILDAARKKDRSVFREAGPEMSYLLHQEIGEGVKDRWLILIQRGKYRRTHETPQRVRYEKDNGGSAFLKAVGAPTAQKEKRPTYGEVIHSDPQSVVDDALAFLKQRIAVDRELVAGNCARIAANYIWSEVEDSRMLVAEGTTKTSLVEVFDIAFSDKSKPFSPVETREGCDTCGCLTVEFDDKDGETGSNSDKYIFTIRAQQELEINGERVEEITLAIVGNMELHDFFLEIARIEKIWRDKPGSW